MIIIKKIAQSVLVSLLIIPNVYAIENLTEDDLAQVSAQDGFTAKFILPINGWTADAVALIDQTGIPATIKPGYDFHAGTILAKNVGIKPCPEASINGACNALSTRAYGWQFIFDTVGDADGNGVGNDPMLSIQAKLLSNTNKLRIYLDKISLRNGAGNNEAAVIDFNHPDAANANKDYFDLLPSDGKLFNLQLGSESTGRMISFGTTVYSAIDFGQVRITDKMDTGVGGNGRNLRFDLALANINLTGAGFDIGTEGLNFFSPNLTNLDVTFNNIAAGSSAVTMGNIGIKGLNLSNHVLTITGKI